jgi:hypothetical protein
MDLVRCGELGHKLVSAVNCRRDMPGTSIRNMPGFGALRRVTGTNAPSGHLPTKVTTMVAGSPFVDDILLPKGIYEREITYPTRSIRGQSLEAMPSRQESLLRPQMAGSKLRTSDLNRQPPSNSVERVRRTSSRKTGCKCSVLAKQSLDGRTRILSHRPDKECYVATTHRARTSPRIRCIAGLRRGMRQSSPTLTPLGPPLEISGLICITIRTPRRHNETYTTRSRP